MSKMSDNLTSENEKSFERLNFGVPLKDAFPIGEIHPNLKYALWLSYKISINSGYTVSNLITRKSLQGNLDKRLRLKDELVLPNPKLHFDFPPGAIFWVIRHFIGLLPTAPMPREVGNQKCIWKALSQKCKKYLADYFSNGIEESSTTLRDVLTSELKRLPYENMMLLATLFNSMHLISTLPLGEAKINKESIFTLASYFTEALLIRPFRPGCETKEKQMYRPLIIYILFEWNAIRSFSEKKPLFTHVSPMGSSLFLSNDMISNEVATVKSSSENSTQTTKGRFEYLLRMVPQSYYDFDFLKDVGCQTNESNVLVPSSDISFCCNKNSCNQKLENKCEFIYKASCCDKNLQISNTNLIPFEEPDYYYDEYSKCQLLSSTNYEDIKAFDPIKKFEEMTDEDSKTPEQTITDCSYESSPYTDKGVGTSLESRDHGSAPIGWNIPTQNAYQLCYGVQKLLNDELKLKFEEMKIKGKLKMYDQFPRSERSLLDTPKMKSKFDFSRIVFNKQKGTGEQVYSKIKYKRIGAISAIL